MLGPRLAAAGDVENEAEDLPADVLDGGLAGGDAAGVNIDQVCLLYTSRCV